MGLMSSRILIIDDDERLAAMVCDYLEGAGFRVPPAPTAFEGQQRLKREQFDALVLDLMLPDGDGLEVCRRIRADLGRADPDAHRARRRDGPRGRPRDRRRRLPAEAVRAARIAGAAARDPAPQGRARVRT